MGVSDVAVRGDNWARLLLAAAAVLLKSTLAYSLNGSRPIERKSSNE